MLNRTHPSVFTAIGGLEKRLGLILLDRTGYRVRLTEAGCHFHERALISLRELERLEVFASQLRRGEETVLRVVIGDLCPRLLVLPVLSTFFGERDRTRLYLDYEALGGPAERLQNTSADLVFHKADVSNGNWEQIKFGDVNLIPVASPGYLPFDMSADVTPDQLRPFTQCVIRDTARENTPEEHFLIEGAHQCTVTDHAMKKELILHGMAWGHLPDFMVEAECQSGVLINLTGSHLTGRKETLAAIRRRDRPHGPVAEALWQYLRSSLNM
jgi:DNA-binding transcriptional LysR family regulator